uniref:Uncharacterized protein n=1 Tax=Agaricus bisporus virus 6 TaxID=1945750 RepID=A0A1Q1M977_9VIRU|nr:hypothetical protein [Agaricus bisporus virus 6]
MASTVENGTIVNGGDAPMERGLAVVGSNVDEVNVDLTSRASATFKFSHLLHAHYMNCGVVNLLSISFKIMFTEAGQRFRIGMRAEGSGTTLSALAGRQNGFRTVSTDETVGVDISKTLVLDSFLSKRVTPDSRDLKMAEILYEKSAEVEFNLTLEVQVEGKRVIYIDGSSLNL